VELGHRLIKHRRPRRNGSDERRQVGLPWSPRAWDLTTDMLDAMIATATMHQRIKLGTTGFLRATIIPAG
jgi:hypothetical protein